MNDNEDLFAFFLIGFIAGAFILGIGVYATMKPRFYLKSVDTKIEAIRTLEQCEIYRNLINANKPVSCVE